MSSALDSFQPSCAACAMAGICLPIAVNEQDLDQLDAIVQRGRPLHKGDHVFHAGDAFSSVFAVRSGAVKTYRHTAEGELQIMGFHLPGEIFGLGGISAHRHPNAAVALDTTAVCAIPFERISELSRELPSLQGHLFQLMSQEIMDDQQLLILLSKKTAEERIAALLLSLSSRFERRGLSGTRFRLPMARGDIGNYLGLVVETVSRVFTRFQKQGVLAVDGREVEVIDLERLSQLAGSTAC